MNVKQRVISCLSAAFWFSTSLAQDFDGLIAQPHDLLGKPAIVRLVKSPPIAGAIKEFIPSWPGEDDIQFSEIMAPGNKTRRVKASSIASLQIDGR